MFRTTLSLLIFSFIIIIADAQTVTLSNAGSTEVNGTYQYYDTYNGRNRYVKNGDVAYRIEYYSLGPGTWVIIAPHPTTGFNDLKYRRVGNSQTVPTSGWLVRDGIPPVPTVTLNVPLPVDLINFNSRNYSGGSNLLSWQTASETNNSGFEIQRSKDGEDWQTLAFVEGKGTTSEKQSYEYIDRSPEMGVNYYRLNQLDHDGASSYSDVVAVALKSAGLAQAFYPNPAKDFIFFPNVEEGVLRLTDITGKEVARIRFSNSNADVSMLPSGTYYGTFVDGLMYKPMLIVKE